VASISRKRKRERMTRDIRNITRGQCQACGDCDGFISVSGRVLCDYCGCPPAHHENLVKKARKNSEKSTASTTSTSKTSDLSEVGSLEILELEDTEEDTAEEDELTSTEVSEDSNLSSASTSTKKSGYFCKHNVPLNRFHVVTTIVLNSIF